MKGRKTMKKMFKRVPCFILALSMVVLCFSGCGEKKDDIYTVGICQLVQHEALDAATKGFKQALKDKLGDKVEFDEQNAFWCASISFIGSKILPK